MIGGDFHRVEELNLIQGGGSEMTNLKISEEQNAENNGPEKAEQKRFK
jgi:hypothetical protein